MYVLYSAVSCCKFRTPFLIFSYICTYVQYPYVQLTIDDGSYLRKDFWNPKHHDSTMYIIMYRTKYKVRGARGLPRLGIDFIDDLGEGEVANRPCYLCVPFWLVDALMKYKGAVPGMDQSHLFGLLTHG